MKNFVKKSVPAVLLTLALLFSFSERTSALAAEKGTTDAQKYNSNTYTYVVEDFSRRITGEAMTVDVDCYQMRLSLTGYGKAGKKINKILKAVCLTDPGFVFEPAEEYANSGYFAESSLELYNRVRSWVTYNDGKYLSVAVSGESWAGGVENTFNTGYTFSLKTGKLVPVTKVTGLSLEQIKKHISDKMTADGDEYDETSFKYLEGMKASDFRYYLNDSNTCVITFGPYELSFGGWFRTFEIKF
ncbi:MAG: hypothetical protein K6E85_05220 [Lachnospiraceae bacterium]|nr:hypothetical protein [Lachnospiraceae bacterium]